MEYYVVLWHAIPSFAMPSHAFEFPTFPTVCRIFVCLFVNSRCVSVLCKLPFSSSRFSALPLPFVYTPWLYNRQYYYFQYTFSELGVPYMHHLQFRLTEERCCMDNINNYLMNTTIQQ